MSHANEFGVVHNRNPEKLMGQMLSAMMELCIQERLLHLYNIVGIFVDTAIMDLLLQEVRLRIALTATCAT